MFGILRPEGAFDQGSGPRPPNPGGLVQNLQPHQHSPHHRGSIIHNGQAQPHQAIVNQNNQSYRGHPPVNHQSGHPQPIHQPQQPQHRQSSSEGESEPRPLQNLSNEPAELLPSTMGMVGPPAAQFHNRDDMLAYVKEWAANHGYAIVIGRSRHNKCWLKCDRGGRYNDRYSENPEERKRKRADSRLTDCPFQVRAVMKKDGIWRVTTAKPFHNHEPIEDLTHHPSLRKMTDGQLQVVYEMMDQGKSPLETLEELQRMWPDIKVLRRDIYNTRKRYRTEKELADIANGVNEPMPYEDPNGKMPGPTRNGRWVWLEDGDEIRTKKKKKAAAAAASEQLMAQQNANLDPDLREQDVRRSLRVPQQQSTTTNTPAVATANMQSSSSSRISPYGSASTSHHHQNQQQHPYPPADLDDVDGTTSSLQHVNAYNQATPTTTRRSTRQTAAAPPPTSTITSPSTSRTTGLLGTIFNGFGGGGGGGTGAGSSGARKSDATAAAPAGDANSSPAALARIERMEKEQREQKQMLAQILGAIQSSQQNRGGV